MSVVRIIQGLAVMGFLACGPAAELRDGVQPSDYHLSFQERLRLEISAPVIVVGRVIDVQAVGQPGTSQGDPRIKTQLSRIRILVEAVVKGSLQENEIGFYYFLYSSENEVDLGVPCYLPAVGQRRIYFLRRWKSDYRSVGDVLDYTIQVPTGFHANNFCRNEQAGCCIADLLLTPGEDMDPPSFVAGLVTAKATADILCSTDQTRQLLEQLTGNPDSRIVDGARDVMAMR